MLLVGEVVFFCFLEWGKKTLDEFWLGVWEIFFTPKDGALDVVLVWFTQCFQYIWFTQIAGYQKMIFVG